MLKDIETADAFVKLLDCNMPKVVWDIETGPESDEILKQFFDVKKLTLPEDPGEFDPKRVKTGNLKDQMKIAEKILTERAKHLEAKASYKERYDEAIARGWSDFVNNAPLNPLYGRVLAIGYGFATAKDGVSTFIDMDAKNEIKLLDTFWKVVIEIRRRGGKLIGHNSNNFDLPFVTRRSWKYGQRPPYLFTRYGKPEDFVEDTLSRWQCGDKRLYVKLDHLAKFFGVEGKMEGITGDMFWKLMKEGQLETAVAYLKSDIVATYGDALMMGLITGV